MQLLLLFRAVKMLDSNATLISQAVQVPPLSKQGGDHCKNTVASHCFRKKWYTMVAWRQTAMKLCRNQAQSRDLPQRMDLLQHRASGDPIAHLRLVILWCNRKLYIRILKNLSELYIRTNPIFPLIELYFIPMKSSQLTLKHQLTSKMPHRESNRNFKNSSTSEVKTILN